MSPTAIWSPCSRGRSFTGTPLTKVPLKLSRSMILNCPASPLMRQCRRDTEGSFRQTASLTGEQSNELCDRKRSIAMLVQIFHMFSEQCWGNRKGPELATSTLGVRDTMIHKDRYLFQLFMHESCLFQMRATPYHLLKPSAWS